MYLETQKPSAAKFSSWVAEWLSEYVSKIPEDVRQNEASFIYILAASPLCEPDGSVRGDVGVIEIGHGSDPAGPPEGICLPFLSLATQMIDLLA